MTAVKICGIRDEATLRAAIEAGADLVGFVHFAASPRHVGLDTAAALARAADGTARSVVLLVDPSDELVAEVADKVAPDMIQLHGHESPERVAEIENLARRPVLKAVGVATRDDVENALSYAAPGLAEMILFDARPPPDAAIPGGNGLAFDWRILDGLADRVPFALAGGLTPDNVAEAVRLTRPAIVDVSSGVESAPGEKDPQLVARFVAAAKEVGQTAPEPRIED